MLKWLRCVPNKLYINKFQKTKNLATQGPSS